MGFSLSFIAEKHDVCSYLKSLNRLKFTEVSTGTGFYEHLYSRYFCLKFV